MEYVGMPCPSCNGRVTWKTDVRPGRSGSYEMDDIPIEVALGIAGDIGNCDKCDFKCIADFPVIYSRVAMVGVEISDEEMNWAAQLKKTIAHG